MFRRCLDQTAFGLICVAKHVQRACLILTPSTRVSHNCDHPTSISQAVHGVSCSGKCSPALAARHCVCLRFNSATSLTKSGSTLERNQELSCSHTAGESLCCSRPALQALLSFSSFTQQEVSSSSLSRPHQENQLDSCWQFFACLSAQRPLPDWIPMLPGRVLFSGTKRVERISCQLESGGEKPNLDLLGKTTFVSRRSLLQTVQF